ncbi:MAG TPA: hypothetical protein VFI56_24285 [Vicinamibacterales bacterium]|nr:hypothetical protein [Vicinamibacterales bacterium]
MSWDDDDIHLGSFSEIGESLRGMQMGAAQQRRGPAQLRGALGQLAQSRFGQHAPLQKTMRSPYKDSTQIGVLSTGTFTLTSWSGSTLPTVSGASRVFKSFKPEKVVITEQLYVTFTNDTLGAVTRAVDVSSAGDTVLISAFSGADNCFPNAPTESNGIPGSAFNFQSLGVGISWPTINGGIDLTLSYAIEQSALYRVDPPAGYVHDDITSVLVKVRTALLGPSLR